MRLDRDRSLTARPPWRNFFRVAFLCVAASLAAWITPAAELASFQAGSGGWHLGTLAVGQLDGDAQKEIVIPYRDASGQWFLDAFKPNGTRLPGFHYAGGSAEINTSPTLADLDGDGRDEIIFTRGTSVIALRGNGSVLWSNAVTRFNYIPNSGYMTATNGFYWSNGGGFIPNLPAAAVFSSQVSSPMVADINGDGVKEIVTAWKIDPDSTSGYQDFNPFINDIWGFDEWGTVGEDWSGGVVFFNATTGAKSYVYHLHQLVESGIALGQADPDKALEVYVLNDSDSVVAFDKTQPHGLHGNGTLHQQFGKNQRLQSGAYQQGVDIYTADLDGDGKAEVLAPMTHLNPLWQPNETILDDDGAILWREWQQPVSFPLNQWQNNACMIPVNPDHDNRADVLSFTHTYEIGFRYWNGVELVNHAGWPKSFYPYLPTPPVVGDVDGDGHEEIIVGTYNPAQPSADGKLYVYALNGALKTSVVVPGGLKHIPTLADVNGDGGVEVIYRSLAGRVYIQNFGATTATSVSWATHRGDPQRSGNFARSLFPAGTPGLLQKTAGFQRATFTWKRTTANAPGEWKIYRAERPEGPFHHVTTLAGSITNYTDQSLQMGWQYFYEIAAVYGTGEVRSAPFAVLPSLNKNLIANGGFEENDNSHWDKWFTGDIEITNMVATANGPHGGTKAMEIILNNKGNNGTVSQYGQYGTPDAAMSVTPGKLYSFGGFFKSRGLSQPSEHWFEWYSTKTGEDTNNRPTRPYPFYFTPHFTIGTSATEWTYANRTLVLPAGFPNLEMTHRYSVAAPASGTICLDDVFLRELPLPTATNWTPLISFRSAWRYCAAIPAANWFAESFNELLWPSGLGKFGAGSGPTNLATILPAQLPAYYFRKTFVVPNAPLEELLLSATCTEGSGTSLEIYLNGTKLVTSGIEAVSLQGNAELHYDLAPFIGRLRPGANTIGVVLNNVSQAGWDDVAFDLSLKAIPYAAPVSARFNSIQRAANGSQVSLNISIPLNTPWRVESNDNFSIADWKLVGMVTNTSGASLWLHDTGQNGRRPPAQTPARSYRLRPN